MITTAIKNPGRDEQRRVLYLSLIALLLRQLKDERGRP